MVFKQNRDEKESTSGEQNSNHMLHSGPLKVAQ
jgi:hypothetical protein